MKQNNAITIERVRVLYARAFASISTALAAALIISYMLREQLASVVLIAWLGFMIIIGLIRYWLVYDYNKNQHNISNHENYENRFIYSTGLVGVGWAYIILSGLSLPVFEYRIYSLLLLVTIIAISVPIFSISIRTTYFYITPSLIVAFPLLLSNGGNDTALGLALIVFTAMVIRSSKDIYNTLNDTITLRVQTLEQAETLKELHHEKTASEERMQGVLDYAPAAIYVKDIEGRFIFLNKKVADLHQMPHDELIGKTLHDILPKDIADVIHQNDIDVIKAKKPIEYQESAPSDIGLRHYLSIKFPLYDELGKIYAIGGVSTDITERILAEESLRISQQRLLLHREQSPVAVIEWNRDFEFIGWNPAAERIFGYSEDEVIGVHITKRILPESARPAVDKVWEELLANKGGTYSVNENTTKDGRTILCEWHNTPLIDHEGKVIGVTSLVDDITERRKTEEDLRHSQKMDAIGKLTGGIAHDFNNMLGVILGFSQLLKERIPDENQKLIKYSNEIITAAERAEKLTSKLLDFSRKAPSSTEITYINKLTDGMRHMLEKTLTPRIRLILNLEDNIWPVNIDKTRLVDSILNISINAMHAMPEGGTLTLSTNNIQLEDHDIKNMNITSGDYVMLSLSDTGSGMSQEIQQQIFDPFFTTKGTEGTGLGLSQVYGFLQQSKSGIRVTSEAEVGTQITIYMPRYHDTGKDKLEDTPTNLVKPPSGKETILVVDDEVALLELAEEILTENGYTVLRAEKAEQALQILENNTVDLLLSDVIMPGMDGFQLATEVEKSYPKVKIQMISGFSDEHKENLNNNTLYTQRITKPYTNKKLLIQVRKLLDEE